MKSVNWNLQGSLDGMSSNVFVGNGFIRSETSVTPMVYWMVKGPNFQHFSIQRAPHKNVTGRNG